VPKKGGMPKKGGKKGKKGKKVAPGPPPTLLPDAVRMAAANGDYATVQTWLDGGGKVDATHDSPGSPDRRRTLLMLASRRGHEQFVATLLQRGAQVNLADGAGTTALMMAAAQGHDRVVRRLLWAGASPAICNGTGYAAQQIAEEAGHALCMNTIHQHVISHAQDGTPIPSPGPGIWHGV
jgi:ankyrin repeat protein